MDTALTVLINLSKLVAVTSTLIAILLVVADCWRSHR